VTRVSWPPSNVTIYKENLLPSCDSAQVVYENLLINGKNRNNNNNNVQCNEKGGGTGWKKNEIYSN
jgi:hypothetical protein